ncbi:ASCH domain-containing protein [Kocuria sp. TGY1127_2]|uniref:ASCH domain-containing protein n=1 Tax=Kocuria sp. TGY1127_2 TaxID=2711328 RepID=UPI0015BBF97C|nr:ASCH domain-containing protein [Kocuria sp. TGY1127_2]
MCTDLPLVEFASPGPLRDQLIAAIRTGAKSTTSSLVREYDVGGEPLPVAGQQGVVIDSEGHKLFVIETTEVKIAPFRDVPLEHAIGEGEGYETVAQWREGHAAYWNSDEVSSVLGKDFIIDDSTPVVMERFHVVRPGETHRPTDT